MPEAIQKHWWVLTLRGILTLIFGIFAILSPGIVLLSLLFYFGFVAIFSGIFLIIEAVGNKNGGRGFKFLEAIVYILFGILFIVKPGFIISFTLYFIAFWAIMAGVFQIIHAIKLRKVIENELLYILNGVITVIFGIMILANVVAGAQALTMLFGIFAIISGILMIILSFKVKNLKKV